MNRVDDHLELPLARAPMKAEIPIELIRRQPSAAAAFSLACQASGLEDKEIYMRVGIDAGTFSRIKKGEATLQADKLAEFCAAVGNTIYPEWLAYQIGCTLVLIMSEAERRLEIEQGRVRELERDKRVLVEALHGKAVG